jgi:hypothetical protein
MHGSQAALRRFRAQGHGILTNTGSMLGIVGEPYAGAYVAKAGIRTLGLCLRQELRDHWPAIRVCTLLPMAMDTPIFRPAANHTGREVKAVPPVYDPDLVAKTVLALIRRPRDEAIVGGFGRLLSLGRHLAPGLVEAAIARLQLGAEPAPPSPGNLLAPTRDGWRVRGGWAALPLHPARQRHLAAAGLLARQDAPEGPSLGPRGIWRPPACWHAAVMAMHPLNGASPDEPSRPEAALDRSRDRQHPRDPYPASLERELQGSRQAALAGGRSVARGAVAGARAAGQGKLRPSLPRAGRGVPVHPLGAGARRDRRRGVRDRPGRFHGSTAPGVAHHLTNPYEEDLVYLMGGERSGLDVGYFPKLKRRIIFSRSGICAVDEAALQTMTFDRWLAGEDASPAAATGDDATGRSDPNPGEPETHPSPAGS